MSKESCLFWVSHEIWRSIYGVMLSIIDAVTCLPGIKHSVYEDLGCARSKDQLIEIHCPLVSLSVLVWPVGFHTWGKPEPITTPIMVELGESEKGTN